jgi:hypothetical protein
MGVGGFLVGSERGAEMNRAPRLPTSVTTNCSPKKHSVARRWTTHGASPAEAESAIAYV